MGRPVLYVLAGVNGAGKSSIGGEVLRQAGVDWFNPDTFARELRARSGCEPSAANAEAWAEGMRRLQQAVEEGLDYAFETTLGGRTVPARIRAAAATHDVLMWFCGLASAEQHIARVRQRVAAGGHDIPEAKIRQRYDAALQNLISLMPLLAHLRVFDNSVDVAPGEAIPDPYLVLETVDGHVTWPDGPKALRSTPDWAKPVVEAALLLDPQAGAGPGG